MKQQQEQQNAVAGPHRWQKGESGNAAGRPVGSRHKFGQDVIQALATDWAAGGPDAVATVRLTDPSTYLRVVASIVPKDVLLTVQQQLPANLSPEAWQSLQGLWGAIENARIGDIPPEQVFAFLEQALRDEFAKPLVIAPPPF
jgi:Family of unknown function (DUF5681)